jgi:hypothetical protein
VADDGVRLDEPADLLDFRITDGETRWLIDGGSPIEGSVDGVVRVRLGSWTEAAYRSPEGAFPDSSLEVRVPELDLDSDTIHDIRIEFFTGTSPLILISGETSVHRTTLRYVIDEAIDAVAESDWREGRYIDVAEKAEFVGLRILRTRITEVEQTVRIALEDPEFSDDDLAALRRYPERLAAAESSARSLRARWPKAVSAEPPTGLLPAWGPIDVVPNPYGDLVGKAEQDAKDAVGRLSGLISSQQIVLTQQQNQDTKRFQRLVTIVGATVLVPGLVAAVFGADVGFHGRDTTDAFWALLLLMLGSAALTYALLRSFEAGVWEGLRDSTLGRWVAKRSATERLSGLGVVGLVLIVVGVAILLKAPGSSGNPQSNSASTDSKNAKSSPPIQGEENPASASQTKAPGTSSPDRAAEKTSKKSGSP